MSMMPSLRYPHAKMPRSGFMATAKDRLTLVMRTSEEFDGSAAPLGKKRLTITVAR